MNRVLFLLLLACTICHTSSFAQSPRKIKKNLSILVLGNFDPGYVFSFEREYPDKQGWPPIEKNFREAFTYLGLKVDSTPSSHRYSLVMDYFYGYIKNAYHKRYKNLVGKIIDVDNPSKPIATLHFNGRYDNAILSDTIAARIGQLVKAQQNNASTFQSAQSSARSKEDRLTELKHLLEKGLITKEDYEAQKTKILNEL